MLCVSVQLEKEEQAALLRLWVNLSSHERTEVCKLRFLLLLSNLSPPGSRWSSWNYFMTPLGFTKKKVKEMVAAYLAG